MARFIFKRVLSVLLTLVAASFLIFLLVEASPSSVARKMLGPFASEAQVEILYERLQLDDPLPERYARWVAVLLGLRPDPLADAQKLGFRDLGGDDQYFGNFGYSTMLKVPVASVIWERVANSMVLAGLAVAVIMPLSIAIGTIAALNAGNTVDRGATVLSTALASIPEFASGVILASIFVVWLGWLPGTSPLIRSGTWPIWTQYVLPVTVLSLYVTAYIARFVRASMIEVMATPYIRTAVLKGLKPSQVVFRHAFRNTMLTPFTVILLQVNWLISGVVVTEVIFAYPGLGRLLLEAALFGDIAIIEAATLIAVVIAALTQLTGDVTYMLLDPRIRLS